MLSESPNGKIMRSLYIRAARRTMSYSRSSVDGWSLEGGSREHNLCWMALRTLPISNMPGAVGAERW